MYPSFVLCSKERGHWQRVSPGARAHPSLQCSRMLLGAPHSLPGYSQGLRAGRQAGDAVDVFAGDPEVILLVALARRRGTPLRPQAPRQDEQQQ